jgi:hypothetical protein
MSRLPHLCCKGSCEFVESSHRTVLLRNPRLDFFAGEKMEVEI